MRRVIQKRPYSSHRATYSSNCMKRFSAAPPTGIDLSGVAAAADGRLGSLRQLSTHMHAVPATSSNAMLSPFIVREQEARVKDKSVEVDTAFLGLLKAMSGLKSSPVEEQMMDTEAHVETAPHVAGSIEGVSTVHREPDSKSEQNVKVSGEPKKAYQPKKIHMRYKIEKAMAAQHVDDVIKLLDQSMNSTNSYDQLNYSMIGKVIRFICHINLPVAIKAMKYQAQRSKDEGKLVNINIYRRVIEGIHYTNFWGLYLRNMVEDIYHHIRDTYSEGNTVIYQHILLPELVAQLAKKREFIINHSAKPIVEYMIEENFPLLDPELYETILNNASINTVGDDFLPYHKLLAELVSRGYKPKPSTVHQLLQKYYPYSDADATCEILQSIKKLAEDSVGETQSTLDYAVDMGTLEKISMASKGGRTDLNLLVWDLVELFQYQPTECLFEDVVLSFARVKSYENSFKALLDMEGIGYVPSHAFLRKFALELSSNHSRLAHARNLLTWKEGDQLMTTSAMNSLLLGYGMRKDLDMSFAVFEDFSRYNLQADGTTFTFLMESLFLSIKGQFADEDVDDLLAVVDTVLSSMELAGVERNSKFIQEYIRVLCLLNSIDDAKLILEETIAKRISVNIGSIVRIATGYLNQGDVENACHVASLFVAAGCGETPQYLIKRIDNFRSKTKQN